MAEEQLKESRLFLGTQDRDSDIRAIGENDYYKIVNGWNGCVSNKGTVVNVPSNILVTFTLPPGTNKCINATEDLKGSTIVFCNYSSIGRHGIYRWFRNKQGYANGVIEKIYEVRDASVYTPYDPNPLNFSNLAEHRITGSFIVDDYFYFTDNLNRWKFIDLVRGNETGKRRIFNVYFNRNTFGTLTNYTLNVWQAGTIVPIGGFNWTSAGTDYETQVEDFEAAFQDSTLGNLFSLTTCHQYGTITMNTEGEFYIQITGNVTYPVSVVPQNFYPDHHGSVPSYDNFPMYFLDRLAYLPLYEPEVRYLTDTTRVTNLVKNKVWQARVRYKYFDKTWSRYGAISVIPIQKGSCTPNNYSNNDNYILIDYTDPRLANAGNASLIENVEISVLEPVLGSQWKTIKTLEQYEFVGVSMQQFRFYNDLTSEAIDIAATVVQFDALPPTGKSDEFAEQRSFPAGNIEGYDKPCIDVSSEVTYLPDNQLPTGTGFSVKGILRVLNFYDGTDSIQPIWTILSGAGGGYTAVFGGMTGTGTTLQTPATDNHNQTLGSKGFIVYLAGTPFYTVSKQKIFGNVLQDPATGVYLLTSSNFIMGSQPAADWATIVGATGLESAFEIKNVPPGEYVLRVANHELTPEDMNLLDLSFQRTSTQVKNIWQFVETGASCYEFRFTITNADIDQIVIDITDLADDDVVSATGYLRDNDDPTLTGVNIINDTPIHSALMAFIAPGTPFGNINGTGFITELLRIGYSLTDHNGFFYITIKNQFTDEIDIAAIDIGTSFGAFSMFNSNGTPYVPAPQNNHNFKLLVRNTDATITADRKTYVEGTILDASDNTPINGMSLVLSDFYNIVVPTLPAGITMRVGKQFDVTDSFGNFQIPLYANPFLSTTAPTLGQIHGTGYLFSIGTIGNCKYGTISPVQIDIRISDTNNVDIYDKTFTYSVGQLLLALLTVSTSIAALKRGGDYEIGLVYYDEGDRKTFVCTNPSMQVHVLYYTEKDPVTGLLVNTGLPVVTLQINHEPPDFAVKYQVVLTKNQQHTTYLDWVANKIEYVDAADVNVGIATAIKVKINLDNIGYYTSIRFPNSLLNYTPKTGDRVRFKKTESGTFYTTYLDYEIIEATANAIYIPVDTLNEFKTGAIFEMYAPKETEQQKFFYEIGMCFEVETAVINGVLKKFHKGNNPIPTQLNPDQTYGTFPSAINTPAQIKLTWGDVYYRTRTMFYNYDPATPTTIPATVFDNINDESVSDFYPSRANGYGRPNIDADKGRIERPSAVRFSNPYISGTEINGLRNFEPLNEKQFSTTYGRINKEILIDNTVLQLIFSNSFMLSVYIGQDIVRSVNGDPSLISISDDVIPRANKMQRQFGTLNPESVVLNDKGDLFGYDENLGVVWRSSGNGLIAISDYKMTSVFNRIANHRNELGRNNSEAPAIYDKSNDFYIISFLPMTTKNEVRSTVVIDAFDMPTTAPGSVLLTLKIQPLNITLFSVFANLDPNYPDISTIIINNVNASGTGYTATLDPYGNAQIFSPNGDSVYYNQSAVLSFSIDGGRAKNFTYIMTNGKPRTAGLPFTGETHVFCIDETKNGWVQEYDYGTFYECYGSLRQEMIMMENGKLWFWNDYTRFNNFSNNQRRRDVYVPFNQNFEKIKDYLSLEINVNQIPFCPNLDIQATQQSPVVMNTELTKSHFRQVLGKFWAKLTRDKNTPDALMINNNLPTTTDYKWTNGREMKGQAILVQISDDTDRLAPMIDTSIAYFHTEKS